MSELEISRVIQASPERVWEVLTDLDRVVERLSGVTAVEPMTDGPYAVGTRWRETRTMFGRAVTEEMWVAETDPWRSTQVRAESGGATYVTDFTLTPLGDGERTELTMRFDATIQDPSVLQRLSMKVMEPIALRATRKHLEQDLADIAAAAEQSPTST